MNSLSKKGDIFKFGIILVAVLLFFGVFVSYFAFGETPSEEKARLEAELAELEQRLNVISAGFGVNYSALICDVSQVKYNNYNCDNLTGYHTVKVLTSGIHNQRFNFSNQIADAHNLASLANVSTNGSVNQFIDDSDTDFLKGNLTTGLNLITSRVVGTGAGANVTINISSLQNQTQNIQQRGISVNASTLLYLRFEEGTGQYANDSGFYQRNNGTLGANTAAASDDPVFNSSTKFGSFGLTFDGVNDFVNISDSATLDFSGSGSFSLVSWIMPDAITGNKQVVAKRNDEVGQREFNFGIDGGALRLQIWNGAATSIDAAVPASEHLKANEWNHIVATWNGSAIRLYANGVTVNVTNNTITLGNTVQPVIVGGLSGSSGMGDNFNGTIDELSIWNISLTNETILEHYQKGWGYFNTSNFTSQIFDANAIVNWSYIAWETAGAYQKEIGRADGDGFSITDDSLVDVVEGVIVKNSELKELYENDYETKENSSPISFVMMLESKEIDNLPAFVYFKLENKTLEYVNSSFPNQIMPHGLVMGRVLKNLTHLLPESISQDRILLAGLFDASLAGGNNLHNVSHFIFSKNSSGDLYLAGFSFLADSSFLTDSSLSGSSSTGCQSILSQNSQSSSVNSPDCLYLSKISRFINLTTAFDMSSESNLGFFNSSGILISPKENGGIGYLNLLEFENTRKSEIFSREFQSHENSAIFDASDYSIIPITEFQKICPTLDCNVLDYITSKKKIRYIKENDYALSLDENCLALHSNAKNPPTSDSQHKSPTPTTDEASAQPSRCLRPAKVNALLDHGVKPIYEMATEDGRAINTTAEHPYLVKLYDKETCDKLNGDVWNKNADEFNGNFCTRWVEVKYLEEGMEIAVPRIVDAHFDSETSSGSLFGSSSNLRTSSVFSTLTFDCFLCNLSLDHKGQFNFSANAKKSTSFKCSGNIDLASPKKSIYSDSPTNSTSSGRISISSVNSLAPILDANNISSLCLLNSLNANCGDIKSMSLDIANCNNLCVGEFFQKKEYKIFVSTTNLSPIQINPCLLSCFNLSSLTLALNLSTSSSVNSLFSSSFSNFSNASSLLTFLMNFSLATSDQLIHENFFNSSLISSGMVNVTDSIYNSPLFFSSSNFFNSSSLLSMPCLMTSFQSTSGNFLLAFSNSSGNDTVMVAIFLPPFNSVNILKSVDIYKSIENARHARFTSLTMPLHFREFRKSGHASERSELAHIPQIFDTFGLEVDSAFVGNSSYYVSKYNEVITGILEQHVENQRFSSMIENRFAIYRQDNNFRTDGSGISEQNDADLGLGFQNEKPRISELSRSRISELEMQESEGDKGVLGVVDGLGSGFGDLGAEKNEKIFGLGEDDYNSGDDGVEGDQLWDDKKVNSGVEFVKIKSIIENDINNSDNQKNKEKSGLEEPINSHTSARDSKNEQVYKLFVITQDETRGWVGGTGRLACLISRKAHQCTVGSNSLTEIPHPARNDLNSEVKFVKIKSIKVLDKQHVYDLSIEGTQNFVANNIIAHNTAAKESPFINTTGLVLLMHFNNETGESERQLNVTHNISAETNLVLYMPFDSASAKELRQNGSTVLLMHLDNLTGIENASLFFNNATVGNMKNGTCRLDLNKCPAFNMSKGRFGAGIKFDGIDDFVNITKNSDFDFKGKDFSITFWANPDSLQSLNNQVFVSNRNSTMNGGTYIRMTNGGSVVARIGTSTEATNADIGAVSSATLGTNQWAYVAVTYSTSTKVLRLYINGALDGTYTYNNDIENSDTDMLLGNVPDASQYYNGTLDEVAVWNVSLTPEIIAKHSGYGIDKSIYGNNASLMKNTTVNQTGCKFNDCMAFVDKGSVANENIINITPNKMFSFGTGGFAIEAWGKTTTCSAGGGNDEIIRIANSSGSQIVLKRDNGPAAGLQFYIEGSNNQLNGKARICDDNWHHIATTRSGNLFTLYVDGVQDGTQTVALPAPANITLVRIGGDDNWNGTLDEIAVWNITLSSDKIAEHAGAKVLDYSNYGNNGSRFSNTSSDFGRNFTDGKFGKGLVFDGVNDYVNVSDQPAWDFGTGTFAINFWTYFTGSTNSVGLVNHGGDKAGGQDPGWTIFFDGTGSNLYFRNAIDSSTLNIDASWGWTPSQNRWYHVAISRDSSSNIHLFVDGTEFGTAVNDADSISHGSAPLIVGCRTDASKCLNGKIDELSLWNTSLSSDDIRKHYERGALKLNLSYRNSQDNVTWTAWTPAVNNNTLSPITGFSIADDSLVDVVTHIKVKNSDLERLYRDKKSEDNTHFDSGGDFGNILKSKDERVNNLPLKSEGLTFSNKLSNDESTDLIRGGCILMNTMPEYFSGGNNKILPRCLSNVNNTLSSDLASSATSLSSEPRGVFLTSNPSITNNSTNLSGIFSSERRFGLESDIYFLFDQLGSVIDRRQNSLSGQLGEVVPKYFIWRYPSTEQFENLPDHYSGAFKSWLSTADFGVSNNVLVNLNDFHDTTNGEMVFKSIGNVRSLKMEDRSGIESDRISNNKLKEIKAKDYSDLETSPLGFSSNLESSFVLNTSTLSCFLSNFSSDQIGQFNFSANAKKSTSSGSGDMFFDSDKNLEYSSSLENLTTALSNFFINSNCDSDKEKLLTILDLCSLISFKEKFGECKYNFAEKDNYLALDFSLKNENDSVVSMTIRIYISPICLSSSNLPFLESLASLTNSSLLNCLAPFIISSMNNEIILRFSSNAMNSSTSFSNFSASSSSNLGISTFNSAILLSPKENRESGYLKVSDDYSAIPITEFQKICPTLDCNVIDYITSKKKIKDIKENDYVLSLDENCLALHSNADNLPTSDSQHKSPTPTTDEASAQPRSCLKPAKVNALLDHGIRPIYEMKAISGKAINTTAEHPYLAKIYSGEECDRYAETFWNNNTRIENEFEEKGFCTRWVEVSGLREGMEIAVPNYQNKPSDLRYSTNSSVVNTFTDDCSLKCGSLDQIGHLSIDKDKAIYSVSSGSEMSLLASFRNFSYLDNGNGLIAFFNLINSSSSSVEESAERILILDLCSSTSLNKASGQCSLTDFEKIISFVAPMPIMPVNTTVASTTKSIYLNSGCNFLSFLYIPALTSLANFIASSSVNLDLETILLNSSKSSCSISRLMASSLATSDQFIHWNLSIFAFNSSATVNDTFAIYASPLCLLNNSNSSSSLTFFSNAPLNTSGQLMSLCLPNLSFNSFGNDMVIVGIFYDLPVLISLRDYVKILENVQIYKPFGSNSDVIFEKISSIKTLEEQHVYDLSIEGTQNFIANDIVAHNTARYFQYKADFNTTDARYAPILNNVSINYSLRSNLTIFDDTDFRTVYTRQLINFTANFTDFVNPINGTNINCTLSHNATGSYGAPIKMAYDASSKVYFYNTTFTSALYGNFNVTCDGTVLGYQIMKAIDDFAINSSLIALNKNFTIPAYPIFNRNVTIIANATDQNNNIAYVNFTLYAPNGSIINLTNSSKGAGASADMYNVSFNLTNYGTWTWNVSVTDADGFIVNSSSAGQIILMQLTENLNVTTAIVSAPVAVSGRVNLSNSSNVSNNLIRIFFNDVLMGLNNLTGYGIYKPKQFSDANDSDFNAGTLLNVTAVGAGALANLTLKSNITNGNSYPNMTGNFTSQTFDAGSVANFSYISWSDFLNNTYGQDLKNEINGSTILYMPFDSSQATELVPNGTTPNASTVLYMKFSNDSAFGENYLNGTNFTIYDYSQYGNNGTLINDSDGGPLFTKTARFGGGFMFINPDTGEGDDYINITQTESLNSPNKSKQITVEAWVNFTGANNAVVSKSAVAGQSSWFLAVGAGNVARWVISHNGACCDDSITSSALEQSRWYHFAGTFDGTDMKLYVDGALVATRNTPGGIFNNTHHVMIGRGQGFAGFNGTIDEVAVWNISLTSEILAKHAGYGIDLSPYRNNATLMFNTSVNLTQACRFGDCLDFNGKTSFINISDSDLWTFGANDFTIEAWVKSDNPPSSNIWHIVSHGGYSNTLGWYFSRTTLNDNAGGAERFNRLLFQYSTTGSDDIWIRSPGFNATDTKNQWIHVAVTRHGNDISFYLNGFYLNTTTISGTITDSIAPLQIGKDYNSVEFFSGAISEVAIWNVSLDNTTLKKHAQRGFTNLSIFYSASNDSTAWSDWSRAMNNTLTATNTLSRYFRYLAKFNTSNANLTPILHDVTVNYTGIFTDSFGSYNYTLTAPTTAATYTVKVNSTYANIPGEQLQTLRVTSVPVINRNFTIPAYPMFNRNVSFVINVTDEDNNIVSINWTINASNGTGFALYNNTPRVGDLHNVSLNLTNYGTWTWNVSVTDADGFIANMTGTGVITLMQITENLNVTTAIVSAPVAVSGKVNLSNSSNVSNNLIRIFFNDVLMGLNNLTGYGIYKPKQFADANDTDFNAGTLLNVTAVGTGALANLTLKSNITNGNSYPNMTGNFTSQTFDAGSVANFSYISWNDFANNKYGQDLSDSINASMVLYMKFDNATGESERQLNETHNISAETNLVLYMPFDNLTGESERQLNATHNISAETNLVLYMPFDSSQATELVPNGSTVLLMHFNNDTGTGENASLFLNNATFGNGTIIANGSCNLGANRCPIFNESNARFGKAALEFGGSNDFINVTQNVGVFEFGTGDFAVSAWVKYTTPNSNSYIVVRINDAITQWWFLRSGSEVNGDLNFQVAGTNIADTSGAMNDGNWHHVAGTRANGIGYFYVDGALIGSASATGNVNAGSGGLGIGMDVTRGISNFNGTIDEVAVWNVSLSSEIIAKHSGYGIDKSIYGNNATLMNGSVINKTSDCKFGECVFFDGLDDFINTINVTLPGKFTIGLWFNKKGTKNGNADVLIGNDDATASGAKIVFNDNPITDLFVRIVPGGSSTSLSLDYGTSMDNSWNFLVVQRDSNNVIKASLNGGRFVSGSALSGTFSVNLLGKTGGASQNFNGSLDEVAIWNTSLSADKISEHAGAKVLDYSGECYDEKTEILTKTDDGIEWKLFSELNGSEEVRTLNPVTKQAEWQNPTAYQTFEHKDFMYKITTDSGNLLVSPKHKVYSNIEEKRIESKSSVENILILSCSRNLSSSDQIPDLEANAKAKYCKSLSCGAISLASFPYLLKSLNGTGSICSFKNENNSASSSLFSLLFDNMTSKFLPISKPEKIKDFLGPEIHKEFLGNKYSGVINSNFLTTELSKNTLNILPFVNNEEMTLLQSTTTNILDYKDCINLCDNDLSTFSDNSLTSSSVNFDLATILFNLANFSNSSLIVLVMNNDTSISLNSLISSSSSLGTENLSSILIDNRDAIEMDLNKFRLVEITEAYEAFKDGKELYFLDENNKPIKVKSIAKESYDGKIYDVDVPNDIVLVKRIDPHMANSSILSTSAELDLTGAMWSGNSNNGTRNFNSTSDFGRNFTDGKFGKGLLFDGVNDYVNVTNNGTGILTVSSPTLTFSAWINPNTVTPSVASEIIARENAAGNTRQALSLGTTGKISWTADAGATSATSSTTLTTNTWYHVAGTYDGTNQRVYVNGVQEATNAATLDTNANLLFIGAGLRNGNPVIDQFFSGRIDEVTIWNISLSSDKISEHAGAKIIDYSQYGNNGTRNFNSTSDFGRNFTDGKFGKGLLFDGVNDYINVSDSESLYMSGGMAIEGWFKPNGGSSWQSLVAKAGPNNRELIFYWNYIDDQLRMQVLGPTNSDWILRNAPSSAFSIGNWHHLAGTWDGSTSPTGIQIYVDGLRVDTTSGTGGTFTGLQNTNEHLFIGWTKEAGVTFFNGTIDEVAVWNLSLESDTIKAHAQRGFTNLSIFYSGSNDSTAWSDWSRAMNNTLTTTNILARYFRYLAKFNTSNSNLTPILHDVTINYTGIFTDSFGNYNYTLTAPTTAATYTIKANSTWDNIISGESLQSLTVRDLTCTCPASGDWGINVADNCVIATDCNMQGNNVYVYGSGTLTINALIYNFNRFASHGSTIVCVRQAGCFG